MNLLKAEQLDSGYTGKEKGPTMKSSIERFILDERNPMGQVPALCFSDNEGNSHVLTQVNSRSVVKWGASSR